MSAVRRAGVCGWPVAHSRSPLIHGYWLARYHLEGAYERFAVPPLGFADFAASIGVEGWSAPTSPCRTRRPLSPPANVDRFRARPGAVNTLWREDGALWGDNTDVAGFLATLDAEAPGWRDRVDSAVVLGAGGAARAIVHGLFSRGVGGSRSSTARERAPSLWPTFRRGGARRELGRIAAAAPRGGPARQRDLLGMAGRPPLDVNLSPLQSGAVIA